jgi:hypothetical protein
VAEIGTSFAAFAPFITTYVGGMFGDSILSITAVVSIASIIQILTLLSLPKDKAGQPLL